MLVLPVIALFLWIFLVGLVRDWRADELDEAEHRWLSLQTLLPWIHPRGVEAAEAADPYPEGPAGPASAAAREGIAGGLPATVVEAARDRGAGQTPATVVTAAGDDLDDTAHASAAA